MDENIFLYPLPESIAKTLISLVEIAERDNILTLPIIELPGTLPGTFAIYLASPTGDTPILSDLNGSPIASLHHLGLVEKFSGNSVFLYPTAFKRAKYEKKSRIGKWFYRSFHSSRDLILGISFTLSLFLTILRIADIVTELVTP